ncbi:MAG: glycosyltransferase [Nitrosopumilaceae archaeon]|nr:glycosyltransferase family 2 protein [Nitrosopumilaceae archaeon]NIU01923.1 glycosyltransferase family 2 protein [Nitrosopumilaceae archaeon]NIU88327.1 glycosyltransferase [Nitrosopumilaceae archaeon]NIV66619.1 glycosyltransferase [Nitrosopumilaceae archaeon]NIX62524.1 glycosyltransferase [Nitrosopumilaceae archaeon]
MITEETNSNCKLVSIIIPTYNESENIIGILNSIRDHLPKNLLPVEAIVVDDNSPDGTGLLVEKHLQKLKKIAGYTISVVHRKAKSGLSSAILKGIQNSRGDMILVMDSDFSHPPQIIPKMINIINQNQYDVVVASRYVKGGKITKWSLKRKLVSKIATIFTKKLLGIKILDPMSGFFVFRRSIMAGINFDGIGYKMLLELLVKAHKVKVLEIPYTFTDRKLGSSKLDFHTVVDYLRSVWRLYLYGKSVSAGERNSVRFLYKAARFYTVGASGVGINYLASLLLASSLVSVWYLHANVVGIAVSMTTNFLLNKTWTFEDRRFDLKSTMSQYGRFITFSSIGALIQMGMVYLLVEGNDFSYPSALLSGVLAGSLTNFLINKKWTFNEKIWS